MTVKDWLGENNQLAQDIWQRKYRHNNESFEEWLDRVSAGDNELRKLIIEKKFLMGGRTLANRGLNNTGSLFNCYSRGYIEDDYYDIMDAAKDIGITFKAQGGQGISLTKLRPKGTPIKTEYYSDGIVPFMKIFNEVTAGTSQGGARKGALMLSIDARHKEAETFIKIKSKEGEIEKANLSLELDDEFMRAVEKYYDTGEVVALHEKRNYSGHEIEYDITPIEIFKMLVDNCYDWADPACLFTNKFRNYNLMQFDEDYKIETCNPCGEQPLPKHGACCLSSLNLSEFIVNPYTPQAHLNTADLLSAIDVGIRTLDKLIDENYNRHPLQQQRDMSYNYRNIGLGIFGYATALMKLGFRYGSPEAIEFTDDVFSLLFRRAVLASNELAKELGPYPKYKEEIFDSDIIKLHFTPDEITGLKEYGLRNCSLVSIAPTGSLATLLGESGGCEPEFALKYTRRTVGMTDGEDTYYDVYCKAAREYMEINNTKELPDYFVGSADISWQSRVLTQAAMQKHVDTAISSTVNMPNSATKDDIAHMYLLAWSSGCKGITMFRDGCKRLGILTTGNKKEEETSYKELKRGEIMKCADDLIGKKRKIINGCGSTHVLGFFEPVYGDLVEVFFTKGSLGGCSNYMVGLSRMVSLACRAGVSINDIQDQLNSTGACPSYAIRTATKHDTSKGACCPMAIGNALMDMWKEVQEELGYLEEPKKKKSQKLGERCPECGAVLEHSGGCDICKECGYSHCN
jgi:ribonucleoside-diphosphate reductase alpha chain|nr:MAG TPA: ribonucleoside-diphosphate reductase, adenosylcobalamin-dependent [Caudoviricetes sp.]